MTEAEWIVCPHPSEMLVVLRSRKTSERKLFLFAVACGLRVPNPTERSRTILAMTERAAEGMPPTRDVEDDLLENEGDEDMPCLWFEEGEVVAQEEAKWAARAVGRIARQSHSEEEAVELRRAERRYQADVLRCIVGNPWRPTTSLPHPVSDTVVRLARTIYEERAWDRLPILADALEENGCREAALLEHLRGPGPHCRGCFALDAVLGKEECFAHLSPTKEDSRAF